MDFFSKFFNIFTTKKSEVDGISATKLRNYFIDDTILDWFNYHGLSKGFSRDESENSYFDFLLNRGNDFESMVLDKIKSKNNSFVDVKKSYDSFCQEGVDYTYSCMRDGIEIIYQGFLYDKDLKIYGIPDLLIRSDIVKDLFENNPEIVKPVNKDFCWSYYVVDIKFSTINLGKKNQILNDGNKRAYKAQIYVYNRILNNLFFGISDNFQQPIGYILSRRIKKNGLENGLNKLCEINYNEEFYGDEVRKALEWVRDVKENGQDWDIYNPHRDELRPNMKNRNDFPWSSAKSKLATEQRDLTRIWHVTKRMRDSGDVLGYFSDDEKRKIIKKMVDYNSDSSVENDFSGVDLTSIFRGDTLNFYVDFEFINGCDFSFNYETRTHLYMIGVGYEENGKWVYRNFMPDYLNNSCEKSVILSWLKFMREVVKKLGYKEYQVIHWTKAEPNLFRRLKELLRVRGELNFVDLQPIIKSSCIVYEGMNNFSLKTVAKSMKKAGLIETEWEDSIVDGLGANMMLIKGMRDNLRISDVDMGEIKKYNEVDCRVMYEILGYLSKSMKKNM